MVPVFNAFFISVLGLHEYAHNFSIHWYYFLLTALCLMRTCTWWHKKWGWGCPI